MSGVGNGTSLGFVGLGVMGSRVVKRLMDAGHSVTGTNRTRSRAEWLVEEGMRWVDTPREVAGASEVVFSMVADTDALFSIADGPDGIVAGLGPGKVFVDMSSIAPAASREVAARVRDAGASMLDSPVSGSVSTLEEGRLSLMVGGDEEAFRRVEPILRQIGPVVTHVGGNGQAVTMKIATNLSLAVQILAFSEGVLLAEKSGIPRETAVQVLLSSVIASPMLKYRGPFVLRQPEEAWFGISMMQKDMLMALELGRELEVPLPTTAVTNQLLTAGRALGMGTKDFAALYEVLASMSGMDGSA